MIQIDSIASIKNKIQKYCELKDINQDDLARELGISRSYLSKLENHRYPEGTDLIVKVCLYFGVGLGEMFYIEVKEGGDGDGEISNGDRHL
ncbi:helix-turn-helix transcriptional regulator [Petroclostridium sp. X23]|uniref:helix-turn-helix transcriptional regulator n=1 Tax=Petroclostridium sp. X23 TaxID=3045146 RepID=UPI0024ADB4AC|nr:helix-turn-helix transcriptional regulator [Petroclostridium sp. X23]WHH61030.1 helix-turn-helix transcriptional regulator [Petroclostridium sp. X23]